MVAKASGMPGLWLVALEKTGCNATKQYTLYTLSPKEAPLPFSSLFYKEIRNFFYIQRGLFYPNCITHLHDTRLF